VEVEAMSQALSPSTNRSYGRARVLAAWRLSRSTFYARQKRALHPVARQRRGPKTAHTDTGLLDLIRQAIADSPFHGEGHRKFWARLRVQGVRTSKQRVLRLMRENQLLAPQRQLAVAPAKEHDGTIVTERPNQMWGTDATATVTLADGQVTVFAAIDHCTAECVGIHAVKRATRFEALEPIRQGVKEYCGGFRKNAAPGLQIRHDHGSQFMSDHFQKEIRFLGMASSPAFVREPEGNGCIERFFRTLKEQLLWVRHFQDIDELQQVLREFRDRYNSQWLIERLNFQSPRQARERFLALQQAA
jgi:transposase InsO family protein